MPEAVVINGAGQPAPQQGRQSTTDRLVDSALDALSDLGGLDGEPANDTGRQPARKPRAEPQRPDTEDADAEQEDALPDAVDGEADEADEADADEEGEPHDTRGSKEEPFSVKDLPADKYIEIKVDGEKTVVSFAELAAGYIRESTFSARINKTKQLADEAQAAVQKAQQTRESVRSALKEFVGDPEQLYEYFLATEDREKVLEAVAQRYAAQLRRFREQPHERLAWQRQRDQARLNEERAYWERQKQEEAQAKYQAEMQQRAVAIFRPGWEAGMRKAGFPQGTPEQMKALFDEVQIRCDQRHRAGHEIKSDDVAEFVVRAAKLLELPKKGEKRPKPAQVAPAKSREERRGKGSDPWAGKSRKEKVKSPDFFLQNLRPRDFR